MSSFDVLEHLRPLIRILTMVTVWTKPPSDNKWYSPYWRHLFYAVQLPITLTVVLLIWIECVRNFQGAIYMVLTESSLLVKLINFRWYAAMAIEMIRECETNPLFRLRSDDELKMWSRTRRRFTGLSLSYISLAFFTVLMRVVIFAFGDDRKLPYAIWLPSGWLESNMYWLAYGYDSVGTLLTATTNTTLDMFYCGLFLQLTLSLKLIGMRLQRLGVHSSAGSMTGERDILRTICQAIQLHQRVKRHSQACERIVSIPAMVQILLSSSNLCFSVYILRNFDYRSDPVDFVTRLTYTAVMVLQIYLWCHYGNQVTQASGQLVNCIYSSAWMDMSAKNRRLIFLCMESLKRPIAIKAGSFFEIGLPIFLKTINQAYSLLALLLNIDDV